MARASVRRGAARIAAWIVVGATASFLQGVSPCPAQNTASQPPAPAPAQALGSGFSPEMVDLIAAHNRERAAAKLAPLAANEKLGAAARGHARDMAEHD